MDTLHPRHRRIRIFAGIMFVIAGIFVVNMLYNFGRFNVPFAVIDLDKMPKAYGFGADEIFPYSKRLIYLGFLGTSILSGLVAIFFGSKLMLHFWRGQFFEIPTINTIRNLGISLIAVALIGLVLSNTMNFIITNGRATDGGFPFVFHLPSYDLGYLLSGILICMIGWVMGEAIRIEAENKEFI